MGEYKWKHIGPGYFGLAITSGDCEIHLGVMKLAEGRWEWIARAISTREDGLKRNVVFGNTTTRKDAAKEFAETAIPALRQIMLAVWDETGGQ